MTMTMAYFTKGTVVTVGESLVIVMVISHCHPAGQR